VNRLRQIWSLLPTVLTSWRTIMLIWFGDAIFCAFMALTATGHWTPLYAAALGGFCFANGVSTIHMKRSHDAFEVVHEAYKHLTEFSRALLEDRVRIVIGMRDGNDDDDDRPTIN